MEVGQAQAFAVELVDIGGLEKRMAVAGHVAIALVVGNDEDHVGRSVGMEH